MRIPRIYVSDSLSVGTSVTLKDAAFNHVVRVLRLKPGAQLTLFSGTGGEFRAILESTEKRAAAARIESFSPREVESPLAVLLAQGLSKGERMDYTLQKAVELGVNAIQPLLTERSMVALEGVRLSRRLRHWRGLVASACEQSGRNCLPDVLEPVSLIAWLDAYCSDAMALVLDPLAEQGLASLSVPTAAVTLLAGPEGGLSAEEIGLAGERGFTGIRLGPRVLRTETAGVAMLAALQVLWGDLGQ